MLFTAVLSAAVLYALLAGTVSAPCLAAAVALAPLLYIWLRCFGHEHGGYLQIDFYAQSSGLNGLAAGFKLSLFTGFLVLCIAADSVAFALAVAAGMSWLTLCRGKIPVHVYVSLLLLPVSFILLSSTAIIFCLSPEPVGLLDLPLPGQWWLAATAEGRRSALLLLAKALGAVTCLYALSLSTPLPELVDALRRLRLPSVVVELMYLIYRYIFILLELAGRMRTAARARLGDDGIRAAWRSFGGIAGNLLVLSFQQAAASFDAMEARCYQGELRFLVSPKSVGAREWIGAGLAFGMALFFLFWQKRSGLG